MARGMSIHIGLNGVDPRAYHGWPGTLVACENDANDMRALAQGCGFQARTILTAQATADNVLAAVQDAVDNLQSGDTLFLSYSGHGGTVPDATGSEPDRVYDTWCFYDRMFIQTELHALWSHFADGVRVVLLSDSCHSGHMRDVYAELEATLAQSRAFNQALPDLANEMQLATRTRGADAQPAFKAIPPDVQSAVYQDRRAFYDNLLSQSLRETRGAGASGVLVSGCQSNQLSQDGLRNGLFTEKLLTVWDNGRFVGDYPTLRSRVVALMPPWQVPNYDTFGPPDPEFEAEKPFTIEAEQLAMTATASGSRTAPGYVTGDPADTIDRPAPAAPPGKSPGRIDPYSTWAAAPPPGTRSGPPANGPSPKPSAPGRPTSGPQPTPRPPRPPERPEAGDVSLVVEATLQALRHLRTLTSKGEPSMSTGFAPTAAPSGWNLGDLTPSITQEVQNFLRSQGAAPGTGMSPGAAGQRGFLDILPQLTQLIPVITNAIQTVSRSQPPVMNPAPGQRGFFDDLTKFVGPILQTAQMLSRSQPPGTGTRDFFGDLVHFLPTAVQIVGTVAAVL